MPDLLADTEHGEVGHVPFSLLNCAVLVGGRLSLGCCWGFQPEHPEEAEQERETLCQRL